MSARSTVSETSSARVSVTLLAVFGGDHAGERATVVRDEHIVSKLRIDLTVRIEHVDENRLGTATAKTCQTRAELMPHSIELVAGCTDLLKHLPSARAIAASGEGRAVSFDDVLPTADLDLGHQRRGTLANRRVGMLGQRAEPRGGRDRRAIPCRAQPPRAARAARPRARRWLRRLRRASVDLVPATPATRALATAGLANLPSVLTAADCTFCDC